MLYDRIGGRGGSDNKPSRGLLMRQTYTEKSIRSVTSILVMNY
jgi:hypothetical protein